MLCSWKPDGLKAGPKHGRAWPLQRDRRLFFLDGGQRHGPCDLFFSPRRLVRLLRRVVGTLAEWQAHTATAAGSWLPAETIVFV